MIKTVLKILRFLLHFLHQYDILTNDINLNQYIM